MTWKSKFFDDFVLLPDPRETPEYDDELRVLIALKTDRSLVELEKWPAMRVERTILRNYRDWNISTQYGTRIEHHMIRYICHLIPHIEPDPWFQEKV